MSPPNYARSALSESVVRVGWLVVGRAKYAGVGPAVLADPLAMILDVVAGVEPDLAVPEVIAAVDQVAGSVPLRRRLAQALHDDPALLASGRPAGPPLIEHLIRALQQRGAQRVVLPRCGHCGRQKPLPDTDGPVRICNACGARRRNRAVCAGCGRHASIRRHDWIGRAFCRRCTPRDHNVDHAAMLVDRFAGLDPATDRQQLTLLVTRVLPRQWEQQNVADELTVHPMRLTGQAAQGTAQLNKLVGALVEHGVAGVVAPACPFCERMVARNARHGLHQ